jgi:5-methylcytosine-specific restriction protein A
MFKGHPRTTTRAWKTTRRRILERDHHICHLCGQPGADTVDHITPLADGGTDNERNLAAAHDHPCHRHKTALEANRHRWHTRTTRTPEPHPGLT